MKYILVLYVNVRENRENVFTVFFAGARIAQQLLVPNPF